MRQLSTQTCKEEEEGGVWVGRGKGALSLLILLLSPLPSIQ